MNEAQKNIVDLLNNHKFEIENQNGFFVCDGIEEQFATTSSEVEQVVSQAQERWRKQLMAGDTGDMSIHTQVIGEPLRLNSHQVSVPNYIWFDFFRSKLVLILLKNTLWFSNRMIIDAQGIYLKKEVALLTCQQQKMMLFTLTR